MAARASQRRGRQSPPLSAYNPSEACQYHTLLNKAVEREDWYYDLHVPIHENYLAHGVWHHNSGKTRLACTLAKQWWEERDKSVLFQTTTDLFDRLRAAEFHPDEAGFTLEHLVNYRLLILDDLGAEKPTEYTCTRLLALLERRHQASRPTIITSNLDLNELGARLGDDRIPSRLADWSDLITVRATDYRVERAAKRRQGRKA